MKVLKFGGTSIGTVDRMISVANLIQDSQPKIVVLSAMAGTTDRLVEINLSIKARNTQNACNRIRFLKFQYIQLIENLFKTGKYRELSAIILNDHFKELESISAEAYSQNNANRLLAHGELLSSRLFDLLLLEMNRKSVFVSALETLRTDTDGKPDMEFTTVKWNEILKNHPDAEVFVTQGFICRNFQGEIDNLGRGGSDYSATIIGSAISVEEVQIWTDVSGIQNNDPRIVENTKCVADFSFEEAAELAYFGAKILHPQSLRPAEKANIPVRLLNTLQPDNPGSLISNRSLSCEGVKAVAAKRGITAIKIKSARMFLAYGFLKSVFEIFERYKTSIDMITTSEVAVSLTIDQADYLDEIIRELKSFGRIKVESNQAIICVVGDMIAEKKGIAEKVIGSLKEVPLRMISYGGSSHNISVLVHENEVPRALNALNDNLFEF